MPMFPLPHTRGCLVCGRDNPLGLHLSLSVDPDTSTVTTQATPLIHHIGFQGIVHGGWTATVADEAMVWSAIFASRRACLAGEFTLRFRSKISPGDTVQVHATPQRVRPRLIEISCSMENAAGQTVATATGKYVPLTDEATQEFLQTLLPDPVTDPALHFLAR